MWLNYSGVEFEGKEFKIHSEREIHCHVHIFHDIRISSFGVYVLQRTG